MARPTIFAHPKFRRLVHDLKMPQAHVLGHLEFLWRVGYESGEAVVGDVTDVEIASEWTGEIGAWCEALVRVRLLDDIGGKYAIHDLDDHAPRYVQERKRKERERKGLRAADKRRTSADARRTRANMLATPAPAPAPAPTPSPAPEDRKIVERVDRAPTAKMLTEFDRLHRERTGKPATLYGGKDAKHLAALWKTHGSAEVHRLMQAFFASSDEFICTAGYSVGVFYKAVPKLQAGASPPRRSMVPDADSTRAYLEAVRS